MSDDNAMLIVVFIVFILGVFLGSGIQKNFFRSDYCNNIPITFICEIQETIEVTRNGGRISR